MQETLKTFPIHNAENRRATAVQLLHLVDFSKKRRACRSVYNKQNIRIVVLTYVWL